MLNQSLTSNSSPRKGDRQALMTFGFSGRDVRVVMRDNAPWWIASDVCKVLGLTNTTLAVRHLHSDERTTFNLIKGCRNNPARLIICESGLYKLILRSDKPEALVFQNWITRDVLPAIRQTGSYSIPVTAPQSIQDMLRECANSLDEKDGIIREQDALISKQSHTIRELNERNKEQAHTISEMAPKADYFDMFRDAISEISKNRPKGVPTLSFGGVA